MGRISYPRTFLNKRKLLFPFLNEMGKSIETLGLIALDLFNSVNINFHQLFEQDMENLVHITIESHKNGWPDISLDTLKNFKTIKPVTIQAGTKFYRVIGLDNFKGNYFLKDLPKNELEFRKYFAVFKHWNGNGGYREITLKEDILAYEGIAAPQQIFIKNDVYVLPGGLNQIWFPSGNKIPCDMSSVQNDIYPTGWGN
jgi:hypothetical protein